MIAKPANAHKPIPAHIAPRPGDASRGGPSDHSYGLRVVAAATPGPDLMIVMSYREREVALLVTAGLSNKEIGQSLTISHWTVSTHLRRIFAKLDITRRVELCAIVSTALRVEPR